MKKILLFLFAVLMTVGAWAQPAVSDAPSNGEWAANTTWHIMYNASNQFLNSTKVDGDGNLLMNNTTASASDEALWCIVGTAKDGYKFYNKAKGTNVVLGISGEDQNARATFVSPTSETHTISFDIVKSAKTDDTYWCMKEHGSEKKYWNNRGNYLAYWNDAEAQKSDNASAFNITPIADAFHSEAELAEVKSVLKVGVGYPKTNSTVYSNLHNLAINQKTKKQVTAMVNAYYASTDIQLPEDGKAYTFTALFKDGKKYNMNYQNGSKMSVSDVAEASIFVCKELRAGVYAFITEDGKILTWVGNDEGNAYKETNFSKPYGYSNYYATTYNNKSDWNEITVKKNDSNAEQLGLLRLVARRHSTGTSSFIANTNKRFDQASDGNWFNNDNTSGWIVTEVEHTNTDAQNIAIAKIAVKEAGYAFGTNVGEYYYMSNDVKVSDKETAFATLDKQATVNDVTTFENSFILNMPEAGKFYRIKNSASTPAYLVSGTHENRVDFATDAATNGNSVFYYAEDKLLSYDNGMYLAKRSSENFMGYAQSVGGSIDIRFAECGTIGKFNIIFNTNRYFYSNGTGSNAGSSDGDQYYRFTLEEVTSLPVVIGEAGYATFYCPVAVTLPDGLKAYYVSEITGSYAKMEEINDVIPANTAVILEGTAEQTYNLTIGGTADGVENLLSGTVADTYKTEDAYVLSAQGEPVVVGFYKATKNQSNNTAFLNHGFKAYLPVESATARFLSFDFGGNETAIDELKGENGNVKTVIYDLSGRRVQGAQKGIYVVNGKVVIK